MNTRTHNGLSGQFHNSREAPTYPLIEPASAPGGVRLTPAQQYARVRDACMCREPTYKPGVPTSLHTAPVCDSVAGHGKNVASCDDR